MSACNFCCRRSLFAVEPYANKFATADDMDDMRSIMGEVNDYAEGLSPEVAALFKDRVSEVIDDIMRGE